MKEKIKNYLDAYFDEDKIRQDVITIEVEGAPVKKVEAWSVPDIKGQFRPLWEVCNDAKRWLIQEAPLPPQSETHIIEAASSMLPQINDAIANGAWITLLPTFLSLKQMLAEKAMLVVTCSSELTGKTAKFGKSMLNQSLLTDHKVLSAAMPLFKTIQDRIDNNRTSSGKQLKPRNDDNWMY